MRETPLLASEEQLQYLFGVTDRTVRNWKSNGLKPVGIYYPAGAKAQPLYALFDVHRYRGRKAAA